MNIKRFLKSTLKPVFLAKEAQISASIQCFVPYFSKSHLIESLYLIDMKKYISIKSLRVIYVLIQNHISFLRFINNILLRAWWYEESKQL